MNVFRNFLIVCGAAWLSHFIISVSRNMILLAVFGTKPPNESVVLVYTQASLTILAFGVLYGVIAGHALIVSRLGSWPLCLAAVAWLSSPASFGRRGFSSALSYALAENAASAAVAVLALITFGVVRYRTREKMVVANSR